MAPKPLAAWRTLLAEYWVEYELLGESFPTEIAEGAVDTALRHLQTLRQKDRQDTILLERGFLLGSPPKGQALHRQRESLR